jgi:phage-related protein
MSSLIDRARNTISADAHKLVSSAKGHIDTARSSIVHDVNAAEDKIKHAETAVSHTIGNVADGIKHGINAAETTIKSDVSSIAHAIPNALSSAGGYISSGVLSAADTFSQVEGKVLPSTTAIISESALVVGGMAIIGLIVLKFL